MKKLIVLLTVCALAAPITSYAAKAKPGRTKTDSTDNASAERGKAGLFAKYDTNKNGTLDADEIAAVQKDFAVAGKKDAVRRLDTNKDGKLSDEEIKALQPAAKRGGKKGKRATEATTAKPDEAKPAEADKKPADPK